MPPLIRDGRDSGRCRKAMKAEISIKIDGDVVFNFHRESEITSWEHTANLEQEQIVIRQRAGIVTLTIPKLSP